MKSFSLPNIMSIADYKQMRFEEGMPTVKQCRIQLGQVASVDVSFKDIKLAEDAHMRYSYEIIREEKDVFRLTEWLDVKQHRLSGNLHTLPIVLESVATEREYDAFVATIPYVLPIYAHGHIPLAEKSASEGEGNNLLYEYLHEELYKHGFESYFQSGATLIEYENERMMVWVMDGETYLISEGILGPRPISKQKLNPVRAHMVAKIEEAIVSYKGAYTVRGKAYPHSAAKEMYYQTFENVYPALFGEKMPSDVYQKWEALQYERSMVDIVAHLTDYTKEMLLQKLDSLLVLEQDIARWEESYNYEQFFIKAYPDADEDNGEIFDY